MRTQEELQQFYEKELRPLNSLLEAKKKEAARKAKRSGITAGVLSVVILVLFCFLAGGCAPSTLLWCACGLVLVSWISYFVTYFYILSQRRDIFKREVVSRIVSFYAPELSYQPKEKVSFRAYMESQIFQKMPDRYRGEDLISGKYSGVSISFSELRTEYKTKTQTKNGTRTTWHTIFRGIFFVADFNKNFQGYTVVIPDIAEKFFGMTIGSFFQKMNFTRPGQLVHLENPEFEKMFAVYSSDQIEARYLLTPKLMERIVELKKYYDTSLSMAFYQSNVYLAITMDKNRFEYVHGEIDWKKVLQVSEELNSILRIVDELDLSLRIWTKE